MVASACRGARTLMMSIALSLAACDSGQSASCPGADFRARSDTSKTASAPETRRRPASVEKTPFGQNGKDYVLTLSEEFDEFNPRLWNDHIWYEKSNPTTNFAVERGVLKIWPQRDATGQFFNRTIDTDGKFEQRYGFFEMEAKLPRGKGTWPAFWLFAHPGDRRPEIDIMEAYPGGEGWGFVDADGIARPNTYAATIWITEGKQAGQKMYPTGKDLSAGFHKYAVKWEPDRQTFYFDGKEIWSRKVSMADSMYVMLDLWFGGASGKPDISTPQGKGNSFEVNYVRAWKFRKDAD
ncbi:MAG: glycoside hydrolase family 16 protein [Noviherbaspirillum sp.]|nr:glycoside hydrolase family 16 protein [Noviherbaspirillum sp.]